MNRRTLLKTLAASGTATLAGCSILGSDTVTVQVVDVNTNVGEKSPLAFGAEVIEDTFVGPDDSEGHPARVRVGIANNSNQPYEVMVGHRDVFATTESDDGRYALLSPETTAAAVADKRMEDECWKLTEGLAYPSVMGNTTVQPGQPQEIELDVVTSHNANECLPEGEFTFPQTYVHLERGDDLEDAVVMHAEFILEVTRS